MPLRPHPLPVDTNVVIECHRTHSWSALVGTFQVEMVEKCVEETHTGFQRRRPEQRIEQVALQQSLTATHAVGDAERSALLARYPGSANLDPGERDLWSHALTRPDAWILCGPDKASLRVGVALGFRDRMVSLEKLFQETGARPSLGKQFTQAWLSAVLGQLVVELGVLR